MKTQSRRGFVKRGALFVPSLMAGVNLLLPRKSAGQVYLPHRRKAFRSAGGGSVTFGTFASGQTPDTSIVSSIATGSVAVTGGQLIAVFVKHEGTATTITVTGGGNTFIGRTKNSHGNGDLHGQWFYVVAAAGGSYAITANFAAARPYATVSAYVYSYTGTATYDAEALQSSSSSSAVTSGSMTTSGAGLVCGGYGEYSTVTLSSARVNGLAADRLNQFPGGANYSGSWTRIMSGAFTGDASATLSESAPWVANAVAFAI